MKGRGGGGKGGGRGGGGPIVGGTKVYVGNLSWETSWQDLKDHFRTVGEVLHADIMIGSDGRSKGCGLVTFAAAHDAARAIQTLHDSVLHSRSILAYSPAGAATDAPLTLSSVSSLHAGIRTHSAKLAAALTPTRIWTPGENG